MSADHKKPAYAFAGLVVLATSVVGIQVRADADLGETAVASPTALHAKLSLEHVGHRISAKAGGQSGSRDASETAATSGASSQAAGGESAASERQARPSRSGVRHRLGQADHRPSWPHGHGPLHRTGRGADTDARGGGAWAAEKDSTGRSQGPHGRDWSAGRHDAEARPGDGAHGVRHHEDFHDD